MKKLNLILSNGKIVIEGSEHDQSEEESEEEAVVEEEEVSVSSNESSESNSLTSEESTPEVNNLDLLTSTTDPTTFEEAVQSSKWRAARTWR